MEEKAQIARKYDLDWSRANAEIAKLALRQGELRLDAQLKIALAADQRAMVSAGICAAFSAAITTATIANYESLDLGCAGGMIAATLLVSAACFLRCAKPAKFKPAGNEPKEWFGVRNDETLSIALGGECENYQVWIEENNEALTNNARLYWRAVRLAMSAPILGGIIFAAFHLPTNPDLLRLS